MKRSVAIWAGVLFGIPLLCTVLLFAIPLEHGLDDPPNAVDALWTMCARVVDFANVTVFRPVWWAIAGAAFVAFRLHHRASG